MLQALGRAGEALCCVYATSWACIDLWPLVSQAPSLSCDFVMLQG